jgi:hypothetical protein
MGVLLVGCHGNAGSGNSLGNSDQHLMSGFASLTATNRTRLRPVPRYYFNTRLGDELVSDPDGEELRDPDRAWEVARAMIRELLKTEGAGRALLSAIIEVTDDEGEIVLEFPFAEAILDMQDESATRH